MVVRRRTEIKIRVRAFRFGKEGAGNKFVSIENRYRKKNKGGCFVWVFVAVITYTYLVRFI